MIELSLLDVRLDSTILEVMCCLTCLPCQVANLLLEEKANHSKSYYHVNQSKFFFSFHFLKKNSQKNCKSRWSSNTHLDHNSFRYYHQHVSSVFRFPHMSIDCLLPRMRVKQYLRTHRTCRHQSKELKWMWVFKKKILLCKVPFFFCSCIELSENPRCLSLT